MKFNVSIVIPVYKTEPFIEKCLRSVCEQTLDNFEIVIIDDCSPDNAMKIVDNILQIYPKRKEMTQIIRLKQNVGSASSRKRAFSKITGKYVTCLDSDDYLELDALEKMLKTAQETDADIVICDYFSTFSKKEILTSQKISNNVIVDLFLNKLHGSYCNKLYKKELLDKITILDNVNMCEDFLAMVQMMFCAKKIVYLEQAFLHYIQYNTNSYTKKISKKSIEDILIVTDFLDKYLKNNKIYKQYEKEWYYRKLFFKFMILKNVTYLERIKYLNIYPEANTELNYLPLYQKTILYMAKFKINCLISLTLKIKNLIRI